jgi:hypothetical protein
MMFRHDFSWSISLFGQTFDRTFFLVEFCWFASTARVGRECTRLRIAGNILAAFTAEINTDL